MYIMHCLCYEKQNQGLQGRARPGEAGQGTATQGRAESRTQQQDMARQVKARVGQPGMILGFSSS